MYSEGQVRSQKEGWKERMGRMEKKKKVWQKEWQQSTELKTRSTLEDEDSLPRNPKSTVYLAVDIKGLSSWTSLVPPLLCAKGGLWVMRWPKAVGSLGLRQGHAGCTVRRRYGLLLPGAWEQIWSRTLMVPRELKAPGPSLESPHELEPPVYRGGAAAAASWSLHECKWEHASKLLVNPPAF